MEPLASPLPVPVPPQKRKTGLGLIAIAMLVGAILAIILLYLWGAQIAKEEAANVEVSGQGK